MTKQKTPVLSLEAHGTLGGSITYQGKGQRKIARTKPRLPYFLTLPSQYQRWLYADYISQWNNLSDAERQVYRSAGSRVHRTGLQEFMRYSLTDLPDLAGYWKLDDTHGATTPDSSRNANHATIIGASPAHGIIDHCLSFDGVNDYINCGHDPSLDLTDLLTIELWMNPTTVTNEGVLQKGAGAANLPYALFIANDPTEGARLFLNDLAIEANLGAPLVPGEWHHIVFTYDQSLPAANIKAYRNGVFLKATAYATPVYINALDLTIGSVLGRWYEGLIDQVLIYNRVLTPADILRHSQRRWPPE